MTVAVERAQELAGVKRRRWPRHLAALFVPFWLPPTVVVAALQYGNLAGLLVDTSQGSVAPREAFLAILNMPLLSGILVLLGIPASVQVIFPGLVLGLPLYLLFVRRGWRRWWHFLFAGGTVGALVPGLWNMLFDLQPLPFVRDLGSASFMGAGFGLLVALIMWILAGEPPLLHRSRIVLAVLLALLLPPSLPAIAAHVVARVLGWTSRLIPMLLTLVLVLLVPLLVLGPGGLTRHVLTAPTLAIFLWSMLVTLAASIRWSKRQVD